MWLDFSPQIGHEQAGRRPAVILSPFSYNQEVRLALLCPVTSRVKEYPFEVPIPEGERVAGVVLADQVKNLDWQMRRAERITKIPATLIDDVLKKLRTFL